MERRSPDEPTDLSALIDALRAERLPVGALELERLRRVLARAEFSDLDRLRALARLVVVKKREDGRAFERGFQRWIDRADDALRQSAPEERPFEAREGPTLTERPYRAPNRRGTLRSILGRHRALTAALLVGLTLVTLSVVDRCASDPKDPAGNGSSRPPTDQSDRGAPSRDTKPPNNSEPDRPPEPRPLLTFDQSIPHLTTTPREPIPDRIAWPLFGLLSATLAGAAWIAFQRRARRLPTRPPTATSDPRFEPRPATAPSTGDELVTDEATRELIWGIERFVGDEPCERIDLPRTVEATARAAGLVTIEHEHPQHDRSLWIWIDEATHDPHTTKAYARTLAARLQSAGLPVRIAYFYKAPDLLGWLDKNAENPERDREFRPGDVESHRESAIVLLLTDGRGLVSWDEDRSRRSDLNELLRGLRGWPRIAFVDLTTGGETTGSARVSEAQNPDLLRVLSRHDLALLVPDDVVAFVRARTPGELAEPKSRRAHGFGQSRWLEHLDSWAAAMALPARSFDVRSARAILPSLRLDALDAFDAEALTRLPSIDAPAALIRQGRNLALMRQGRNLAFRRKDRLHRIDWLTRSESHRTVPTMRFTARRGSLLTSASRAWRQRIARELVEIRERDPDDPQILALELQEAVVRLHVDPEGALSALEDLAVKHPDAANAVRAQLGDLVPGPTRHDDHARLAWTEADVRPATLDRLRALGLSHRILVPGAVHWPAPFVFAGTALVALALGAILCAFGLLPSEQSPQPLLRHRDAPSGTRVFWHAESASKGGWLVASPQWSGFVEGPSGVAAGRIDSIAWRREPTPNPEPIGPQVALWRAGYRPLPLRPRAVTWPVRSAAWIAVEPSAAEGELSTWERFAVRALDAGIFDLVLIAPPSETGGWQAGVATHLALDSRLRGQRTHPRDRNGALEAQIVVFTPRKLDLGRVSGIDRAAQIVVVDSATLPLPRASRDGEKPLTEVWPAAQSIAGQPLPWVAREGGLDMVALRGGSMPSGSEQFAGKSVEAFEISRYEVTRGDWRALGLPVPDPQSWGDGDDDSLPANNLSWFDAVRYCNRLSLAEGYTPRYYADAACTRVFDEQVDDSRDKDETPVHLRSDADGYRLPTDLQWEYACRAGTTTKYHWGDAETAAEKYAWFGDFSGNVKPVGQKLANSWGLHDMTGNVWEWCENNPDGASAASVRSLRGGSFVEARLLASSFRYWSGPSRRVLSCGFRVVRSSLPQHGGP